MKKDIKLNEVEIPDGYEATGEYRFPREDEPYMDTDGTVVSGYALSNFRIILRKVEPVDPEYRSFELDWQSHNWPYCGGAVVDTGRLIFEKWRIFEFGDDLWFDPDKTYSTTASHRTGNYKYAYGRLEK